jgi:radical SAM superfamily enzyme YgiQ (UPF0313 family)
MDEDIAKWLSNAGCRWVQMGVQSMDEGFKKDNLMRYERSEDVSEAIDAMNKYGLKVKVDHMFGLPDEPISAQENARKLYVDHKTMRINTFWTCYLPGTELMNEAIAKGRLSTEQQRKINEGEDFFFFRKMENITDHKLIELYQAYEVIFRIMPVLPTWLKARLSPNMVLFVPKFLIRPLSMISDAITGLMLRNPDFTGYAKHNIFQLKKFFLRKMGIKNVVGTRIMEDVEFNEVQPTATVEKIKAA